MTPRRAWHHARAVGGAALLAALVALAGVAATAVQAEEPPATPTAGISAPTPPASGGSSGPTAPPEPAAREDSAAGSPGGGGGSGGGAPSWLSDAMAGVMQSRVTQWVVEAFNQTLLSVLQGIADALWRVIDYVLHSSFNVISQTPPALSYDSATVRGLWDVVRAIANAGLVLVVLWGGFNLVVREHLGTPYHGAMELLPRVALGFVVVNTSLWWGRLAIDANNALCAALGGAALPAWESSSGLAQALVSAIATLLYLVMALLLVLQQLMRLALIDVLLVVAPLALLCWVLPQTQGWARLWTRTFTGTVFSQFVQVVALKLGTALIPELAPASLGAELVGIFLGIAVLALTLKLPSLVQGHMGDGLGFARYYAYRRAAQAVGGGSGGSGGGSGGSAGSAGSRGAA